MQDRFLSRLALVTAAALLVAVVWQSMPLITATLFPPSAEPRAIAPRGDLAGDERLVIELFEAARDSVVSITTQERVVDYFTRNTYEVPRGTGSGFVWDARGHIVTNAHVIAGASRATIRLADGRTFRASLVGADRSHDLAVLRIDVPVNQPPPLPIGTSEDLQVGQKVLAIGNPFGLDFTLTTGIISALGRELPNQRGGAILGLIQTDAAINPGNSGGPLIDTAGRLIGVNTAIYSRTGSNAGIGFAVPVDTVNRVVPQLIASGRYEPPSLGVSVDPRSDAVLARMGLSGAMVLSVNEGSAADSAGLRPARIAGDGSLVPGDVIVGLGDAAVENVPDLIAALDRHRAGDSVTLAIVRDGERIELPVTLDPGI